MITLIFADRALTPAVMVVIRRELPRTSVARSAMGLSHRSHEDPPFRVPLDRPLVCSVFMVCGPTLAAYAARRAAGPCCCSTCTPMAQMKPNSSRATAVTACCLVLPLPISR